MFHVLSPSLGGTAVATPDEAKDDGSGRVIFLYQNCPPVGPWFRPEGQKVLPEWLRVVDWRLGCKPLADVYAPRPEDRVTRGKTDILGLSLEIGLLIPKYQSDLAVAESRVVNDVVVTVGGNQNPVSVRDRKTHAVLVRIFTRPDRDAVVEVAPYLCGLDVERECTHRARRDRLLPEAGQQSYHFPPPVYG